MSSSLSRHWACDMLNIFKYLFRTSFYLLFMLASYKHLCTLQFQLKAKTNKISDFETLEVVNHKWTCLWAFLLVYQNLEPDCFVVKHISNLAQVLFQLGLQLLIHMISFVNLLVFGLFCLVLIRSLDLLEQNSCIPSITCMREVITMQHTIS